MQALLQALQACLLGQPTAERKKLEGETSTNTVKRLRQARHQPSLVPSGIRSKDL